MKLTNSARAHIADSNFALPDRRYPIHDVGHARAALSMVAKHGTPEEKSMVRSAVEKKYPEMLKKISEMLKKQASEPVINKYIDLSELQRLVRRDR